MKDAFFGLMSAVALAALIGWNILCFAYSLYQPCLNETWIWWHPGHVLAWQDVCGDD